jgi:hypothetical protein
LFGHAFFALLDLLLASRHSLRVGGGESAKSSEMVEFSEADIRKRYVNPKFVPSLDLDGLAAVL